MALLPSMKHIGVCLLSVVLLTSYQKPIAVQHFKSDAESTMSVTAQMVKSALTTMRDEASTTTNKWLTLEARKTILYHYYDLDDELGFSMNTLTRAVKLFGSIVDSKVSGGNSTGVHFRMHSFIKCNKDGEKLGSDRVRFLLLTDSKELEPNEPTDSTGWRWFLGHYIHRARLSWNSKQVRHHPMCRRQNWSSMVALEQRLLNLLQISSR